MAGTVAERPARRPRKRVPRVEHVAVVVVGRMSPADAGGGRPPIVTLLRKRPDSGLLAGMWEFPSLELAGDEKPADARIAAAARLLHAPLRSGPPHHPPPPRPAGLHAPARHLAPRHLPPSTRPPRPPHLPHPPPPADKRIDDPHTWVALSDLGDHPLPVAQRKIAAQLGDRLRGTPPAERSPGAPVRAWPPGKPPRASG